MNTKLFTLCGKLSFPFHFLRAPSAHYSRHMVKIKGDGGIERSGNTNLNRGRSASRARLMSGNGSSVNGNGVESGVHC